MNRFVSRPAWSLASRITSNHLTPIRHKSNSSNSSGGKIMGKALGGLIFSGVVAGGGIIGYASYDSEFREMFQENVPLSKEILDALIGDESIPVKLDPIAVPPSKMKLQIIADPPMPDIEEPPEKNSAINETPVEDPVEEIKEELTKENVEPEEVKVEEVKVTEEIIEIPIEEEEVVPVDNDTTNTEAVVLDLEKELENICNDMNEKVKNATEASNASIEATRHHMALLRSVMDGSSIDDNRAWNELFDAATQKSDLLKQADEKLSEAKSSVSKAIDKIESGRKDSTMNSSETLKQVNIKTNNAVKELEKAVSTIDSVQKEAQLVEDYRNLVEESRQQFQKEIEAILPERKIGKTGGGALSEEDLNIFMTHAYRKVCQLQEELAKAKTFEKPAQSPTDSECLIDEEKLQIELDNQRREMELDQHKKMTTLRNDLEKELRKHAKRQAAAHVDHINDVLEVQSKELERLHERALNEAIANEQAEFKREMAVIKGTLDALDRALDDKNFMKNASIDSQELWLACISLQQCVKSEENVPLEPKIQAIEKVASDSFTFANDEFIKTLLEIFPKAAKSSGIPSGGQLKARFNKVESMAKRTALIGDQGGSLYLYGLSYLQSLLLLPTSSSNTKYPNKSRETIDVNNLNTIDIVTFARQALEQDDLEQAVKYMNLLSGEPKKQASDWLKSARLHLEVGQLCEALTSYVTAIGAEAIPASAASKN